MDVTNERYHILIDRINSFKQLDHENAKAMHSRLNVLVNEINSLGVKKIQEPELIRKMLHSLRRPDYDLVTTILYEKDLTTMTPNQVLNTVTTHKLRNDIKPRAPPSSPTHSFLTSKQEKLLKKMAIKQSSSEEEESQCSSSDEDVMSLKLFKQVKIMNKSLKKINMMGYMVVIELPKLNRLKCAKYHLNG